MLNIINKDIFKCPLIPRDRFNRLMQFQTLIIDPQVIFLGGDISKLPYMEKLFLEQIKKDIIRSLPFDISKIKLSLLGED